MTFGFSSAASPCQHSCRLFRMEIEAEDQSRALKEELAALQAQLSLVSAEHSACQTSCAALEVELVDVRGKLGALGKTHAEMASGVAHKQQRCLGGTSL